MISYVLRWRAGWRVALCGLALAAPALAQAQLGLPLRPGLPAVGLPGGELTRPLRPLEAGLDALAQRRVRAVAELLERHADRVEADPAGQPVRRGELLLLAPAPALLAAARERGYALLRERVFEGLDERWVVLRPPAGRALADALTELHTLDPQLEVEFNHLYLPAGEVGATATAAGNSARPTGAVRVGLVDGGVDAEHPSLRGVVLRRQGCEGGSSPQTHGTAVASLLVGAPGGGFRGAAPGATLYAADIYCGAATGGAVEAVIEALAWLARERVAVINLSLVGPPNRLLERSVRTLVARGHLLVAAVGNDGPAAPPLYPAAYPGVVGVTAVSAARRLLPEAARGPQVTLSAPGSDLAVARAGASGYASARGTSFAAPLVAGLLAARLAEPEPDGARRALDALVHEAVDLGTPGRDSDYGWGLVAEGLRTDPRRVGARQALQ